jgi:hypothetical protein
MATSTDQPEKASVRLRYGQILPNICARCGAPAKTRVQYEFFERPHKVATAASMGGRFLESFFRGALMSAGGAGGGGMAGEPRGDSHTVLIPFCRQHERFRKSKEFRELLLVILAFITVLTPVILGLIAIAIHSSDKGRVANPLPAEEQLWVGVAVFLVWSLCALSLCVVWTRNRLDVGWVVGRDVGRNFMVLSGVAPEFAAAVEAMSQRENERVEQFLDESLGQSPPRGSVDDFLDGLT